MRSAGIPLLRYEPTARIGTTLFTENVKNLLVRNYK